MSRLRVFIVIGLAVIILSMAVRGVRVNARVHDLQTRLGAVEQLTGSEGRLDFAQVRTDLSAVKNDLADIRSDVGWLLPAAPFFGWLPQIGGDIAETSDAFNMAEALVAAADLTFDGWSPLLDMVSARAGSAAPAAAPPITERLIDPLVNNRALFVQAKTYLDSAAAYRAHINVENLSARTAALVKRVDRIQPLMNLAVDGGMALPQLLGASGPRTYLIVAQNEDELRATGGFVSAVGRLTLDHGKIIDLTFNDSYQVDNLDKDFPQPPAPLQTYMLAGYWLFRDANWSPDFPSSARQLASLYTLGQNKPVDGVIALDQEFVRALIEAVGPIEIAGGAVTSISADNLLNFLRAAWAPPLGISNETWLATRKDFIGNLAKAMQAQMMNGGRINWLTLARAVYSGLRERHLSLYVSDRALAQSLAQLGWDGAVRAADGDYLMVVDSNLGFNKANALLTQSFQYSVSIVPDLTARARLDIHYRHGGEADGLVCAQLPPEYTATVTYAALMNMCFWDYLRLYVPQGSVLREASRYPLPAARMLNGKSTSGEPETLSVELNKNVFATFFVVDRGEQRDVHFAYDLARGVVRPAGNGLWSYSLYWQKQAGTQAIAAKLVVTLPNRATLARADASGGINPSSETSDAGLRVTYQFNLATDFQAELVFRRSD